MDGRFASLAQPTGNTTIPQRPTIRKCSAVYRPPFAILILSKEVAE